MHRQGDNANVKLRTYSTSDCSSLSRTIAEQRTRRWSFILSVFHLPLLWMVFRVSTGTRKSFRGATGITFLGLPSHANCTWNRALYGNHSQCFVVALLFHVSIKHVTMIRVLTPFRPPLAGLALLCVCVLVLGIRLAAGFARQTGDLRSLSRVDLKVIALTYMLERQETGAAHLRTKPSRPVTIRERCMFLLLHVLLLCFHGLAATMRREHYSKAMFYLFYHTKRSYLRLQIIPTGRGCVASVELK